MKFYRYRDGKGEWRWRLKGRNGKILADSAESYKRLSACTAAIQKIIKACVVDEESKIITDE